MTIDSSWPVPFILNPNNLAIDAVASFCVSVLLAVMINAEAQAFVSTFLGDSRVDAKDRMHFNAFLHLDILGTICYLVGGFGWPRTMKIDASKFKRPRLYMVISRLAGPMANLLLAAIGGSIVTFMNIMQWEPRVFLMVIGVNVTTAVYHLLPIPPLAMGSLVTELMPPDDVKTRSLFRLVGPYLIVALTLLDRITHQGIISSYFDPLIKAVYTYCRTL
jgi:Zn-dependent protease